MIYSLSTLLSEIEMGAEPEYLMFWGHNPHPSGEVQATCFSQWWAGHPFTAEGIRYLTAEHWMMAEKARLFGDQACLELILKATHPGEAKKLGRQVRGFDQQEWEARRSEIVVAGNLHKFSQHLALNHFLLATATKIIVEASPYDRIWGIGLSKDHPDASLPARWKGLNLLGFALMEVRDRLQQ